MRGTIATLFCLLASPALAQTEFGGTITPEAAEMVVISDPLNSMPLIEVTAIDAPPAAKVRHTKKAKNRATAILAPPMPAAPP